MTQARKTQVSLDATPYYHCITRCVRRAFLCGDDRYSGRNFDHRREWLLERLRLLASVFAIDICAYAVMSNHYHLVLHVDAEKAASWGDDEVIARWLALFHGPLIVQRHVAGQSLLEAEKQVVAEVVAEWRERLSDISWFMRCLNEHIARRANEEDGCKGRFWEGRFKTQALLDERALLACMAYVDLNPIRAGMADRPELSDFTSIQQRLFEVAGQRTVGEGEGDELPALQPFQGAEHLDAVPGIPFTLGDYIELVEWTGRAVRPDKRGYIPPGVPSIVDRLGLEPDDWVRLVKRHGQPHRRVFGSWLQLQAWCEQVGQRWVKGQGAPAAPA
ncbi:MAG: transposase [Gammaproteobacteria bacterium]|nr:MAG: transposase [Gammaproteobacteria bacterium]